jgi:hypothetical protein
MCSRAKGVPVCTGRDVLKIISTMDWIEIRVDKRLEGVPEFCGA